VSLFLSSTYLLFKYIQYFPYRKIKTDSSEGIDIGWFAPSANLFEFEADPALIKIGFWGELKNIDSRIVSRSIWFLVPYLSNEFKNHKLQARFLEVIHQNSAVRIFPIASEFDIISLFKIQKQNMTFSFRHIYWLVFRSRASLNQIPPLLLRSFNGVNFTRNQLNDFLIRKSLSAFPKEMHTFYLLEGQPWEASLVQVGQENRNTSIGVVHTPFRQRDSQILNIFIGLDEAVQVKVAPDIVLCPDEKTFKSLEILSKERIRVVRVEAHRFPFAKMPDHTYSNRRNSKILYVEDTDHELTICFVKLFEEMNQLHSNRYELSIKCHPALPKLPAYKNVCLNNEPAPFQLFVFGEDTSAIFQDQFARCRVALFSNKIFASEIAQTVVSDSIYTISQGSDLLTALQSEMIEAGERGNGLFRNQDFRLWRSFLAEVVEYRVNN
jgi:hypothetical protein